MRTPGQVREEGERSEKAPKATPKAKGREGTYRAARGEQDGAGSRHAAAEARRLSLEEKAVLAGAVVVLGAHAIFWNSRHWDGEKKAKAAIKPYDVLLGVPTLEEPHRQDWTTEIALFLLAVAALIAVIAPAR